MNRKKREQLILEAAIRVFCLRGYDRTSVSEIIEEAEVARGTFYLYFKSKKELLDTLVDRLMLDISRDVSKIRTSQGLVEGDSVERIRLLASDLIKTVSANRLLLKILLLNTDSLDHSLSGKLEIFSDQLVKIVSHNIEQNIKSGEFRSCSSEIAARCILGSVKEMIVQWILKDTLELEPTIMSTIDYLLNGLTIAAVSVEKDLAQSAARQNLSGLH